MSQHAVFARITIREKISMNDKIKAIKIREFLQLIIILLPLILVACVTPTKSGSNGKHKGHSMAGRGSIQQATIQNSLRTGEDHNGSCGNNGCQMTAHITDNDQKETPEFTTGGSTSENDSNTAASHADYTCGMDGHPPGPEGSTCVCGMIRKYPL